MAILVVPTTGRASRHDGHVEIFVSSMALCMSKTSSENELNQNSSANSLCATYPSLDQKKLNVEDKLLYWKITELAIIALIVIVCCLCGFAFAFSSGTGGACWNPVQRVCSLGSEGLSFLGSVR